MSTDAELVPCLTVALPDGKELLAACEEADIRAELARDACCGKGGCGCAPKVKLLVGRDDVPRVAQLMDDRWRALMEREGTADPELFMPRQAGAAGQDAGTDEHEPCPACGTAAPLVEGACSDCGLQLE